MLVSRVGSTRPVSILLGPGPMVSLLLKPFQRSRLASRSTGSTTE